MLRISLLWLVPLLLICPLKEASAGGARAVKQGASKIFSRSGPRSNLDDTYKALDKLRRSSKRKSQSSEDEAESATRGDDYGLSDAVEYYSEDDDH